MLTWSLPSTIRDPSRHSAAPRDVDYRSALELRQMAVPDSLFSEPTAGWQQRQSFRELTIGEALEDPLIKLLNSADGFAQAQFEELLLEAARDLGVIAAI